MMKIEGREITDQNYLDPVIYVPSHANGNAGHPDCEKGVLIRAIGRDGVRVLYCSTRTVQLTPPECLVWG